MQRSSDEARIAFSSRRVFARMRLAENFRGGRALSIVLCMPVLLITPTAYGDGLSPWELRGRQIYREGRDGSGHEIMAFLALSGSEVSAQSFPCSNCHGPDGEGAAESGLLTPGLNWSLLISPSQTIYRSRPGFDEASLRRAIQTGVDSGGNTLHAAMPRFHMSPEQSSALIAYLRKLGGDVDSDPGITADAIRLGTSLPLSGSLSTVGSMLKSTLSACIAEVNAQGGLYGRKLELVAVDSESAAGRAQSATWPSPEGDVPFAVIASYQPGDSQSTGPLPNVPQLPLIGPISLASKVSDPSVFYLLPDLAEQARALVDFLALSPALFAKRAAPRLAIIQNGGVEENSAAEGVRRQARLRGLVSLPALRHAAGRLNAKRVIEQVMAQKADGVFFFGAASEFADLGQRLARESKPPILLSLLAMVGRSALELPAPMTSRTYLASPFAMSDARGLQALVAVLKQSNVSVTNPGLQAQACATVRLFAEAAKQAGRRLSRVNLVRALEGLHDVRHPLLPPLSYSPSRRNGSNASMVVGIEAAEMRFVPLSDWIVPAEGASR